MQEQVVKALVAKGFTKDQAETAYDTYNETLKTELTTGDGYARVAGIGSYKRVLRKGREYSNPQNRAQKIVKGDRYDVKFNSDKSLEAAMPTP